MAQLAEAATQAGFRQVTNVTDDSAGVGSVGMFASVGFRSAVPPGCRLGEAARVRPGQWLNIAWCTVPNPLR
jgi:L-amino acid N-acyltransferase YncA